MPATAVTETALSVETAVVETVVKESVLAEKTETAAPALRKWVLDGKTFRGSHRLAQSKQAQSTLTLYDLATQHVVAQRQLAGKGHEHATALALVQDLDLHGIVLSTDALHTQPAWCRFVLPVRRRLICSSLKPTNACLHEDIAFLFSEESQSWLPEQHAKQVDQGHGRLAIRSLRTSCELNDYLAPKWPGVAQVFQLHRAVRRSNRPTTETVYGLMRVGFLLALHSDRNRQARQPIPSP